MEADIVPSRRSRVFVRNRFLGVLRLEDILWRVKTIKSLQPEIVPPRFDLSISEPVTETAVILGDDQDPLSEHSSNSPQHSPPHLHQAPQFRDSKDRCRSHRPEWDHRTEQWETLESLLVEIQPVGKDGNIIQHQCHFFAAQAQ